MAPRFPTAGLRALHPRAPLTMRLEPFRMERWQSLHEHDVRHNLSESGVHPLTIGELLALPGSEPAPPAPEELRLGYAPTAGAPELRARIAALYPGASSDHVLVTHGGAEANFLAALHLTEPGDEVLCLLPTYMQLPGLVRSLGARVRPWRLRAENDWRPDPAELDELAGVRTRAIVVTSPNNPTGRILDEETLDAVARAADRTGAWVLSDEVYRGAELEGPEAPSMWGRCERLLITSSLSKAYGLAGLRVGWIASPRADAIEELWGKKDYTSIADSGLTMGLAALALDPVRRGHLLARTRARLRANLPRLTRWLAEADVGLTPLLPEAGAILWTRYDAPLPSEELAERLRVEGETLIVPGAQFDEEGYLRLGFGGEVDELTGGLTALARLLEAARRRS